MGLTDEQREGWERDGFFCVPGFASGETLAAMEARVVEMARADARGESLGDAYAVPEKSLSQRAEQAEEGLSKVFRVHRQETVFQQFACDPRLHDWIVPLIGNDLDCFLSQFIFKLPGALGQPWHQDAFYFPFDRGPQVGVWLAVTEAALDNGPMWVLPGSHREPVHEVVADRREHANYAYVEIVDHDMGDAVPVLLQPGDALFFHSHLMHMSTDNQSAKRRAAMVYHFGEAGTVDQSQEKWGFTPPNVDWMPVRRRIETETLIDAAPARVRELLGDASRYPEWNPYLVRIEGTIEAGAEIVAHGRSPDGSEMAMPVRVVEAGELGMRWQGGLPDTVQFLGDHHFVLEPLAGESGGPDERTRLRHFEDFTGTLLQLILGERTETIRGNFERMNEGVRAACESPGRRGGS